MIGAGASQLAGDRRDLVLDLIDQVKAGANVSPPGVGELEAIERVAALDPEQIAHRAGHPEVDQGRVDAVLERRAMLDQVQAKAGQLTSAADPGVGEPDRRHRIAVGEQRQHPGVDAVGLAGDRRQALDPLGVGDQNVPAVFLQGVVAKAGAGHRLDHPADRLAVFTNAAGERPQTGEVGTARRTRPPARPRRRAGRRRSSCGSDQAQRATYVGASLELVFR
jgi:hypothetical protein